MLETRRQFLKKSVAMLGGAALLGSVPFAGAMAEGQTEAPRASVPVCRAGSGRSGKARV